MRRNTPVERDLEDLEVLDPAAFAGALEVLLAAAPAAPLGEPDPLEVQDLEDEERDYPGDELGLRKDVHRPKLHAPTAACNGPGGLFSGTGWPTPDGNAPGAA
jgi:hypothetical protein